MYITTQIDLAAAIHCLLAILYLTICLWFRYALINHYTDKSIFVSGIPINKSLYTVSYMLITSASAGITFCAFYLLVSSQSQSSLFEG